MIQGPNRLPIINFRPLSFVLCTSSITKDEGQRTKDMKTALLLIAHGSRQNDANADLHYFAAVLRERGDYPIVEASFLELAEPNIEQGTELCVAQGADCVVLLPYFLSAGIHVRRDL